jgi:succinate-semialdehyde dehydrogenase/glutarate-semialdehyde dehydrogenase
MGVWFKMNNNGQCCVAAKRFIVVDEWADRFLEKFSAALALLKPIDPMAATTTLGPLSTEAALQHFGTSRTSRCERFHCVDGRQTD